MINSRYYVFIESQPVVTPAVFGWGELEMLWAQQNTKKIRKYRHRHTSSGWLRGLIFVWVVYITPFFFFLNWMISEMFWSLILQLQSSFLCFMAMWSEVNRNFSLSKSQRFEGRTREECWTWVCFYFENNHSNHPFFFLFYIILILVSCCWILSCVLTVWNWMSMLLFLEGLTRKRHLNWSNRRKY